MSAPVNYDTICFALTHKRRTLRWLEGQLASEGVEIGEQDWALMADTGHVPPRLIGVIPAILEWRWIAFPKRLGGIEPSDLSRYADKADRALAKEKRRHGRTKEALAIAELSARRARKELDSLKAQFREMEEEITELNEALEVEIDAANDLQRKLDEATA